MSKGAKGEKSLKKIIKADKGNDEKLSYPGALELDKNVKAIFIDGKIEACKIIKIRDLDSKNNEQKKEKNEYSYEYYVHFLRFDRRNDHWIKRDQIIDTKVSDDEAKKLIKEKEEKNIFQNNENEGMDKAGIKAHEEATKVKTVDEIVFGKYKTETWYFSPLPEYYHQKTLYFCEFCLDFFKFPSELNRHMSLCTLRHPPGNEIYRDGLISVFEVDGKLETRYCQNLCYISKMFLDHKTLQYDVDPFLFYIVCEYDKYGYHDVGYFSKEKDSIQEWNLSCILTFPFHQRKGYGKFMIDFSYLLSKTENKFGTPERPLSDLGFSTYFSYWTGKLCKALKEIKNDYVSINELSEITHIKQKDIHQVLTDLQLLKYHEGQYIVIVDKDILEKLEKKSGKPGYPLDPSKLIWTPYKTKYDIN